MSTVRFIVPPPTSRTTVPWLDPALGDAWDDAVAAHPQAGPFHTAAWARTLRDAYGYRLVYARADLGHGAPGLIPVAEIDSVLTGRRGACLPFADACAPLLPATSPGAGEGALLEPVLELGRRRGWRHLEIRSAGDAGEPVARYVQHELPLTADEDEQRSLLAKHHRRHLRRAERAGVRIEWRHDAEAMAIYYRLHLGTRKRQGVPPQPRRFFRALHRHLVAGGQGVVGLALLEGAYVAGAVFLHHGEEAVYKYGASDDRGRDASANHALMWSAIRRSASIGATRLSFGRTDPHADGLAAFKEGWGAAPRDLIYRRIGLRAAARAGARRGTRPTRAAPPDDGRAGAALQRRILRLLPVPVLQLCGSVLYRHVG